MQTRLLATSIAWLHTRAARPAASLSGRFWLAMAVLGLATWSAPAQLQTAGTLYVNVDATTAPVGLANGIPNSGTLGGVFDSTNPTPLVAVSNVNAILFTNTYLWLTNASTANLIQPAPGMVGAVTSSSIEVWALNPSVASDESVVSWGARNTAANMNLEYGSGGSGGVSHNGTGNDAGWDFYGGYPAPGLWHYLVVTYDGVRAYLYSDGVLVNNYPPANLLNITNSLSVLLGAQWNNNGTSVSTSPGWATLALARVRVESGTLTPAQIVNNYNFEKAAFPPPPVTAAYLSHRPVHRYTFDEPATNDASGLTFHDSIGTADGIVQASASLLPPAFTGRRLVLHGDISSVAAGYGYAYGDLPNGIVSGNSTNNGGTGELSIELWYRNDDLAWSWSRLFDFGSCGDTNSYANGGQLGQELTSPGGFPSPGKFLDSFYLTAQNGNNVGQRQVGWQNLDVLPGTDPTATNAAQSSATFYAVGNYQTDRHVVVTWKESTGQIIAYDNGYFAAQCFASNSMSVLNDVNCWLGRSMNNDQGFGGEYEEVRFYTNVLTPGEVLGDFQTGPNTLNTGAQAASIITQPTSRNVYQGWPVTLYVTASGSPAVSYQWNLNSSPIPGATSDFYTLAAADPTNGGIYTCTVSNNTGSPNVQTSGLATLTVVPNVAPPPSVLHETKSANPGVAIRNQRDEYDGTVGCSFTVGSAGALVSHLGFYDVYGDGLSRDHLVSIYTNGISTNPVVSLDIPAGTDGILTNFYRYAALPTPVWLAPNTVYILQADTYNGDGDMWSDLWQAGNWSPYFVGTHDRLTRYGRYGSHGSSATGLNGNNNNYGAPNLAIFPQGPPVILAVQSGVTQYVNLSATLNVAANGQAPLTCQWYKAGTPNTLLPGQTGLALSFSSVQATNEGNYYAIVNNGLGSAQSSNIYLRVFADTAVSITQQPTNVTVLQNYSATFSVAASGTPPIGYQWYRNSTLIPGETDSSYTLAAAQATNNNDVYTCVVSNFANASPQTMTSLGAILTVTPNLAPVPETLIPTVVGTRDNYSGMVGAMIQIGATPAKVSHLGYYLANPSGLNSPHHVDIFSADGSQIVAEVFVTGTGDVVYNGYAYVALSNTVTLAANTSYILAAEVYGNSGDPWPDVFVPSAWNPYYVGASPSSTRQARYGGNYPAVPTGPSTGDGIYGAPNMALLTVGAPVVTMDVTNQSQYATANATFTAFVNGQPPVVGQWFKVGPPDTRVPGQTSSTLTLNNLQMSDAGTYYLMATNSLGTGQGPNATLTVLAAAPPHITTDPQPQTVYVNQQATFTVASSVPPDSYQWWFGGSPIPYATNSSYTVYGADPTKQGNYTAILVNGFGSSTSAPAMLTVLPAPPGYAAAVLQLNPMVYYPFEDIANNLAVGNSNAFNLGNLGTLATGLLEGSATNGPGPQPPAWPNFNATNQALVLDPFALNVDVKIPPLNLDPSIGANVTLAAWINPSGPQENWSGIIFNRGIGGASGLGVKQDTSNNNLDMLEYHWANSYYQFNSGLYPTNYGNWAFVALAVQPDRATLYLNDGSGMQSAVNIAAHAAASFASQTYVGYDNNDPDPTHRRFVGSIDEPMIFGRTLSPDEINALYHAGIGPVKLQVSRYAGRVVLTWPLGVLQQSTQPGGGYSDTTYTSPYTNSPGPVPAFYRVRIP